MTNQLNLNHCSLMCRCQLKDTAAARMLAGESGLTVSGFVANVIHELVRDIDLSERDEKWSAKEAFVSLILDLFYAEMRQLGGSKQVDGYRQLRSFIMVDEAHQFLKKDFNSLRSIISEGRMFGVGMILSTQNLGDFRSANEDYSQFILSWVIHHVNSISKTEIASIFGATDKNAERYMDCINHAQLFESVCKIGENVNAMRDLPFFELVTKEC